MDTISCERNRLLLSQRSDGGLSQILFPKRANFQISQFEIEDGIVKISLSKKVSEQAIEKYRGRYLEHLKKNLENFSLVYRKDGRFHGIIDLKQSYDLAHTKVAYKCDATTEQIEASIRLFQSQKTASNLEPNSEGRIRALEAELAKIKKEEAVSDLVKLEEERNAKEAEARRLAKLKEERKAKEAEARRLAELEEERTAIEAEALRVARLEEEKAANKVMETQLSELEQEWKKKRVMALQALESEIDSEKERLLSELYKEKESRKDEINSKISGDLKIRMSETLVLLEAQRDAEEAKALALLDAERKKREAEIIANLLSEYRAKGEDAVAKAYKDFELERNVVLSRLRAEFKDVESSNIENIEKEYSTKETRIIREANSTLQEQTFQIIKSIDDELERKKAEIIRIANQERERRAKDEEARQLAMKDKSPPEIFARVLSQDGFDAQVGGQISDDTGLDAVLVNGKMLDIDRNGNFEIPVYIPKVGKQLVFEAIDKIGKISRFTLDLERQNIATLKLATFEELLPSKRKAKANSNALAILIGIEEYQRTEVPAVYADRDASFFFDYATLKLGVPEQNIIELVNDKANEIEIALAIENFLKRRIKRDATDVYIFYAGHGLATDDGSEMYLLPYDGEPQLLERTAISRKQLFNEIAASNPKSVTVFLDTCYSGTTRGTETLIASRPIAIKAKQKAVPEGFTVMTAAAGDQTAKPLEEAKHGMFSYFLMKGMEGDADANQDNQITAGELHAYVQQNVTQQSSGSQTPELQGDANKVLVRFQ